MRTSNEVHNFPRTLQLCLDKVRSSSICEENKKAILDFHQHIVVLELGLARQVKYLSTLQMIAKRLVKPFGEMSGEDIAEFVTWLQVSPYSEWTKRDYKIIFKIFYRWLKKSKTYPDEVAWIKSRKKQSTILPEDLISDDEVIRLVKATHSPRDKGLLLLLSESGCRIGELLSLSMKNVAFDQYGAQLIVNGKTGSRRVRLIDSVSALSTWLDNHPYRDNPDSAVWISTGVTNWGQPLAYSSVLSMLRSLTREAGITKRIYPHLFRHTRATYLSKFLPEAVVKEIMGWVQDSKSAARYVHLSGRDVDKALLRLYGVVMDEDGKQKGLEALTGARFGKLNSPT